MLLDKKRVSLFTKVGAVVLTAAFAISFIPAIRSMTGGKQSAASRAPQFDFSQLEKQAQDNPKDVQAMVSLANSYFDAQEWDKAIKAYQSALTIEPKNVDVRTDLAIALFRSGQLDAAIAEGQKATQTNPNHALAHFNLGVFLSSAGRGDEAAKEWNAYLKLEPKGEQAQYVRQQLSVLKQNK